MRKALLIIAALLSGCETYSGLYIDSDCTQEEIELITLACDKLNEAVGEDILYINEVTNTSEDDLHKLRTRDVVICYPEDTDYAELEGLTGFEQMGDIHLRRRVDKVRYLRTVMHELGHYIGAWHTLDENSIMFPYNNGLTEYNGSDLAEFQRVLP